MKLPAPALEQRLVGCILDQSVLELILGLRRDAAR